MNILLDFGAIKTGGGVQLALNFLDHVEYSPLRDHNLTLAVPDIGPLSTRRYGPLFERVITSPRSYLARLFFEYFRLQRIMRTEKIDAVFTFFGAGLPHPKRIVSLVTVAYPIICYPESPYWGYISWRRKVRIRALNFLRKHRLKSASKIIAETEVMKSRLATTLRCEPDKIVVIPPAPTDYVTPRDTDRRGKVFLFPSGNDDHKNLWRLYSVAQCLLAKGMNDFLFVLTVDRGSYMRKLRETAIDEQILDKNFHFIGSISPDRIMDLYNLGDYVVSLSDLESFSNNYMEAWKVGIPLIASDRDFARGICGDGALYVEPHVADDVADKFIAVTENANLRARLVESGRERLTRLPSPDERFALVARELLSR